MLKSKHQTQRPLLYSNQHVKRIPLSNYHVNSDDFYLTLFKINLLLCRHFDISSVLLFNRTFGSARAITIFLSDINHTFLCHIYIRIRTISYPILDGNQSHLLLLIWKIPCHQYGKFRVINMENVSERLRMIIISRFELPL